MSHDDHDNRLTKLETTVQNLAVSVETLTATIGKDREAMWSAIENGRTRITWPIIVTTCGFLLGLGMALGGAMDMVTRLRIDAVRAEIGENRRDLERHERQLERFSSLKTGN